MQKQSLTKHKRFILRVYPKFRLLQNIFYGGDVIRNWLVACCDSRGVNAIKTFSVLCLACLTFVACKDETTNVQNSLQLTLTIQKDTTQTGYSWIYFLHSNYDIILDSVVCSYPSGSSCGRQYWPFGLSVTSGVPTNVGGEFCSFSEYPNFIGIRRQSIFGSRIQGTGVKFSRTIEVMIR